MSDKDPHRNMVRDDGPVRCPYCGRDMWEDVFSVGTDWTLMRVEHGMQCPRMAVAVESEIDGSLAQNGWDVRGLNAAMGHRPAYARPNPGITGGQLIAIVVIAMLIVVILAAALS